jgi:hypothetical protein
MFNRKMLYLNLVFKALEEELAKLKQLKGAEFIENSEKYNNLIDFKKDVIKLMILAAQINQKDAHPESVKYPPKVTEYLKEDQYTTSAPVQRNDVNKFKNELQSMNPEDKKIKFDSMLKDLQTNFKLKKMDYLPKLASPVIESETIIHLRRIRNEVNNSIIKARTDAERDLERNPDYKIGIQFVKSADEILMSNMEEEKKVIQFYELLKIMRLQTNFKIEYLSKHTKKSTDALKDLASITNESIKDLEKVKPDLKYNADVMNNVDKKQSELRSKYVQNNKKRKEKIKEMDERIKVSKSEKNPRTKVTKIFDDLLKRLALIDTDAAKRQYHHGDQTIQSFRENTITHLILIVQDCKYMSDSVNNKLATLKEQLIKAKEAMGDTKTRHKVMRFFATRSPQEKLADMIEDGLKAIEKIEKRYKIAPPASRPAPPV